MKVVKNKSESIRSKLYSVAKNMNKDFNAILLQYAQERFLYRLSISPYRANLLLKGGMFLKFFDMPSSRPTTDIDFLGLNLQNDYVGLENMVKEIVAIDYDDGVVFNSDSVKSETIKENDVYQGIRITLVAFLGNAKSKIQLDIGFGDKVVPSQLEILFPTILSDSSSPEIFAYSPESAIAEKFQAIVSLGLITSRMKDFYDIYYLSHHYQFHSTELLLALETTFRQRNTELSSIALIFNKEFMSNPEKHTQTILIYNNMTSEYIQIKFIMLNCLVEHSFYYELYFICITLINFMQIII